MYITCYMEDKNIIIILSVIVIILAIGTVVEVFVLNNSNSQTPNITNNTTSTNTTVESISTDSQEDANSIDTNRPTNDPNYKGYTPYHESEVTSDGWNPSEHEVSREDIGGGSQRISYDDGYFRIVDENGYVITYGYA